MNSGSELFSSLGSSRKSDSVALALEVFKKIRGNKHFSGNNNLGSTNPVGARNLVGAALAETKTWRGQEAKFGRADRQTLLSLHRQWAESPVVTAKTNEWIS